MLVETLIVYQSNVSRQINIGSRIFAIQINWISVHCLNMESWQGRLNWVQEARKKLKANANTKSQLLFLLVVIRYTPSLVAHPQLCILVYWLCDVQYEMPCLWIGRIDEMRRQNRAPSSFMTLADVMIGLRFDTDENWLGSVRYILPKLFLKQVQDYRLRNVMFLSWDAPHVVCGA